MTAGVPLRIRVLGRGRAGGAFAGALAAAGHHVETAAARGPHVQRAAVDVDLLLVCTPDHAVAPVAAAVAPGDAVVGHVAGSLTLDVLGPHPLRCSIHPLVALPSAGVGAARLAGGGWFAVAGSAGAAEGVATGVVASLGGRAVRVADDRRALYHAAAAMAANHLVALLGSVARVAAAVDVPLAAYLALAQGSLDDVAAVGPADALTGPVARGDRGTVQAHLEALAGAGASGGPDVLDLDGYRAMARLASRLAGSPVPWPP